MELSSILLARTIALFETGLLNPRGSVSRAELVPLIVNRFSFAEFPSKLEDFDASKGITFKHGYFNGQSIEELTIYNDGIKIDLRSSTEKGQRIILDSLQWMSKDAKITYTDGMITRWAFLSQMVVQSSINLDAVHPAYQALSKRVGALVSEAKGEDFQYRVAGINFNFERLNAEYAIAPFLIERRLKTPDSENRYYSQAPLQTEEHLEVLREFERNLT